MLTWLLDRTVVFMKEPENLSVNNYFTQKEPGRKSYKIWLPTFQPIPKPSQYIDVANLRVIVQWDFLCVAIFNQIPVIAPVKMNQSSTIQCLLISQVKVIFEEGQINSQFSSLMNSKTYSSICKSQSCILNNAH